VANSCRKQVRKHGRSLSSLQSRGCIGARHNALVGTQVGDQRRFLGGASLQEQLLMKSVNSVIVDLAVDEPTVWMPQPDFSDHDYLKRKVPIEAADLLDGVSQVDPFNLVQDEVVGLSENIKQLLGSDHPVLSTVARYFFEQDGGKKMRPTLVLLMSRAANAHESPAQENDKEMNSAVYASQIRLGEITEMIHTASLLHDDVIDVADTRRGVKSVNQMFGNKLAILAGDFLLARASICLARLRNVEVVEIMSTSIEHLVKGEVMQMKSDIKGPDAFEYYLRKNYYKTGSLIANSILAGTVLGGHSEEVQTIAFEYGEAIGHAFQLIDDALDFEGSIQSLGKPALADLKQGLATAPILFAQDDFPELRPMIERKFSHSEDVDRAATCVLSSGSIAQTRNMAMSYAEKAIRAVLKLKPSPERDALVHLALKVVNRTK